MRDLSPLLPGVSGALVGPAGGCGVLSTSSTKRTRGSWAIRTASPRGSSSTINPFRSVPSVAPNLVAIAAAIIERFPSAEAVRTTVYLALTAFRALRSASP